MRVVLAYERARAQCRRLYPASPQERLAIGTVWDIGPVSMSDLARAISLSLPATSALVDRLVLRGFLVRAPDERDRRRTNVSATPLPIASMDGPVFEGFARMVESLDEFPEDAVEQFHAMLVRLYGTIDGMGQLLAGMSDEQLHSAADGWDSQHAALVPHGAID